MDTAQFRFYAELNDFLPEKKRYLSFDHHFEGRVSVKHLIESLGVPHTEVDLILANSKSVHFDYIVADGDLISVYPVFESIDISDAVRLRPQPLRQSRFVLDIHLGQLARYLRLLGFDTLYQNDYQDEELARISNQEGRILLSRDRGLLKRNLVSRGYCVRESDPQQQLIELTQRFDLRRQMNPFQRCLRCNGVLEPIAKEAISQRLMANTRQYYQEFRICSDCRQIYWKGSHYHHMTRLIKQLLDIDI